MRVFGRSRCRACSPAAPSCSGRPARRRRGARLREHHPGRRCADFFDDAVPGRLAREPRAGRGGVGGVRRRHRVRQGLRPGRRRARRRRSTRPRSLVRIASITKLFTWTAVMQQVEAGRLDLRRRREPVPDGLPDPGHVPRTGDAAGLDEPHRRVRGPRHRHRGPHRRRRAAARRVPGRRTCRPGSGRPARSPPTPTTAPRSPATSWPRSAASPTSDYIAAAPARAARHGAQHRRRTGAGRARRRPRAQLRLRREPAAAASRSRSTRMAPDGSISATAADMARFMTAHLRQGRWRQHPRAADHAR